MSNLCVSVLIVKSVSDWFENEWIQINTKRFAYFILEACELRWDLKGYYSSKNNGTIDTFEIFQLAPEFNVKTLVLCLDIRAIIGNQYRKPINLLQYDIT